MCCDVTFCHSNIKAHRSLVAFCFIADLANVHLLIVQLRQISNRRIHRTRIIRHKCVYHINPTTSITPQQPQLLSRRTSHSRPPNTTRWILCKSCPCLLHECTQVDLLRSHGAELIGGRVCTEDLGDLRSVVRAGVSEDGRRGEGSVVAVAVGCVAIKGKERGEGAGRACEY